MSSERYLVSIENPYKPLLVPFSSRSLMMDNKRSSIRVLIAKPGLDGHDRGARVVAMALRDAGIEVIYTGLRQTVDQIVNAAIQEDVDVIGLSILSGVHLELTEKLIKKLKEREASEIKVIVGGVIPLKDIEILKSTLAVTVFRVGTPLEEIVGFFRREFTKN